jgi:hypothetical protein
MIDGPKNKRRCQEMLNNFYWRKKSSSVNTIKQSLEESQLSDGRARGFVNAYLSRSSSKGDDVLQNKADVKS